MPSSALRIVEKSAGRLVILNPPYYWVAAVFLLIGLFLVFVALSPDNPQVKPGQNTRWLGLAVATPFLLAGVALGTSRTRIVLDRGENILRIENVVLGIPLRARSMPFVRINHAIVESNVRRGRALSLRLQGGAIFRLTGASTQAGYGEAAEAINQFLARHD